MPNILDSLSKAIAPVGRRLRLFATRSVVTLVDDSGPRQRVQLSILKKVRDPIERFQNFGFYSVPPPGSEAVVIFIGGDQAHGVVLAVEPRDSRPPLEPGEVAMAAHGALVRILADGSVLIESAAELRVRAPRVAVEGDLSVTGNVSDAAGSMQAVRDVYNLHTHPETGTTTLPPEPLMPPIA